MIIKQQPGKTIFSSFAIIETDLAPPDLMAAYSVGTSGQQQFVHAEKIGIPAGFCRLSPMQEPWPTRFLAFIRERSCLLVSNSPSGFSRLPLVLAEALKVRALHFAVVAGKSLQTLDLLDGRVTVRSICSRLQNDDSLYWYSGGKTEIRADTDAIERRLMTGTFIGWDVVEAFTQSFGWPLPYSKEFLSAYSEAWLCQLAVPKSKEIAGPEGVIAPPAAWLGGALEYPPTFQSPKLAITEDHAAEMLEQIRRTAAAAFGIDVAKFDGYLVPRDSCLIPTADRLHCQAPDDSYRLVPDDFYRLASSLAKKEALHVRPVGAARDGQYLLEFEIVKAGNGSKEKLFVDVPAGLRNDFRTVTWGEDG